MKMKQCFSRLVVFFLVTLSFESSQQDAVPRVETKVGVILGRKRYSDAGKELFHFTGIPYIEPPLGELRFKPPRPAKPFIEEFNATRVSVICPQNYLEEFNRPKSDEDCVVLDVHTPWDPSMKTAAKPLPVMVFFHPGGFVQGSSTLYGAPDYFLEHDVVVVTVNYRLGVLGFLSTGDEEAPGNYGLLDQVEALKWVKENIAAFGGNPDKVTISGILSGGTSVHYLVLSPLAKGLFHGAIAQSGTVLQPMARTTISNIYTEILAEKLDCPTSTSSNILACLRKKDAMELVKTDVVQTDKRKNGFEPLVWLPRIDNEAVSPFLPSHPIEIIKSGKYNKVPLILGHTKDEGAYIMANNSFPLETYEQKVERLTEKWDNTCKVNTATREYMIPEERGTYMCNQIKDHYIDPDKTFEQNRLQYAKMVGDMYVVTGVSKTTELMAHQIPMYRYVFRYDVILPDQFGAEGMIASGFENWYLFNSMNFNRITDSPPYSMVQIMTKIWTDFAKTGEATIPNIGAWPRATPKKSKYVVLDLEPHIEENYRPEDMEFMKGIYTESLYNTGIGHYHNSASTSKMRQLSILPLLFITVTMFIVA